MSADLHSVLDRQLLLQLGDRLKELRRAMGMGTVEMAERVGITRNTLRAVETGDPQTSIGIYLRVMSALGISGELALLAGDVLQAPPARTAAARSRRSAPTVQVTVTGDDTRHRLQDLQSLVLHEEAVRLAKSDPALVARAQAIVSRWLASNPDSRSANLWREWHGVLEARAWKKILGRSRYAQQLRQASPLVPALPEATRSAILEQARQLKRGVSLGANEPAPADKAKG